MSAIDSYLYNRGQVISTRWYINPTVTSGVKYPQPIAYTIIEMGRVWALTSPKVGNDLLTESIKMSTVRPYWKLKGCEHCNETNFFHRSRPKVYQFEKFFSIRGNTYF